MNNISEITRRDILDIIKNGFEDSNLVEKLNLQGHKYYEEERTEYKITYYGRLSEIDFLNRIYDLKNLPSTDSRFSNAEHDIYQHTVNNWDWDNDWVFSDNRFGLNCGEDDVILNFVCEIFHPVVRIEGQEWQKILSIFNELLQHDGYELYEANHISGRAIYRWRELSGNSIVVEEINPTTSYSLKMIGEGSYAHVYKYFDKFYDDLFVLKRAKPDLSPKELQRFKVEFDEIKSCNCPYIVKVYRYSDDRNEYVMEH